MSQANGIVTPEVLNYLRSKLSELRNNIVRHMHPEVSMQDAWELITPPDMRSFLQDISSYTNARPLDRIIVISCPDFGDAASVTLQFNGVDRLFLPLCPVWQEKEAAHSPILQYARAAVETARHFDIIWASIQWMLNRKISAKASFYLLPAIATLIDASAQSYNKETRWWASHAGSFKHPGELPETDTNTKQMLRDAAGYITMYSLFDHCPNEALPVVIGFTRKQYEAYGRVIGAF